MALKRRDQDPGQGGQAGRQAEGHDGDQAGAHPLQPGRVRVGGHGSQLATEGGALEGIQQHDDRHRRHHDDQQALLGHRGAEDVHGPVADRLGSSFGVDPCQTATRPRRAMAAAKVAITTDIGDRRRSGA